MLLKNLFFDIYLISTNFSFYLGLLISLTSYYLLVSSLRRKFAIFILTIIVFSMWGFLHNLDGMMLVLLTAEFTILLLLIMTYIQLYANYTFLTTKFSKYVYFIYIVIFIVYGGDNNCFFFFTSFYKGINHIVASDFYILYYFLFEKLPLIVILLTLIISFFSLFFIILYFNLKSIKLKANKELKSLFFLRKQNLFKQTSFNHKLYTFQY